MQHYQFGIMLAFVIDFISTKVLSREYPVDLYCVCLILNVVFLVKLTSVLIMSMIHWIVITYKYHIYVHVYDRCDCLTYYGIYLWHVTFNPIPLSFHVISMHFFYCKCVFILWNSSSYLHFGGRMLERALLDTSGHKHRVVHRFNIMQRGGGTFWKIHSIQRCHSKHVLNIKHVLHWLHSAELELFHFIQTTYTDILYV